MLIPPADNAPTNSPGGFGYATITNKGGVLTFLGTLADGTSFNQVVALNDAGSAPLFASCYRNTGLLVGWLNFETNSSVYEAPSGTVTWIKKSARIAEGRKGILNTLWQRVLNNHLQDFQARVQAAEQIRERLEAEELTKKQREAEYREKKRKRTATIGLRIVKGIAVASVIVVSIVASYPIRIHFYLQQGERDLVNKSWTDAIKQFERALQIDSSRDDAWMGLATAYRESGALEKAAATLKHLQLVGATKRQPMIGSEDWVLLGDKASSLTNFKLAEEYYVEATHIAPSSSRAHFALANVYKISGKFTEAESTYKEIIKGDGLDDYANKAKAEEELGKLTMNYKDSSRP